jgi:Mor family transcriptional regulator
MSEVIEADIPDALMKYVENLGVDAALRMCHAYGGEQLYVPKIDALALKIRDKKLLDDYHAGTEIKTLAHKYDLAESTVYATIRAANEEKNSLRLFEE